MKGIEKRRDIDQIYNILLQKEFYNELFSDLEGNKTSNGGRELIKRCPFCGKENHFYISTEKPVYRCFRCNESGDWINYLQRIKGMDFKEALYYLAKQAGVTLQGFDEKKYSEANRKSELLETAKEFFIKTLFNEEGKEVLNYLKEVRGYDKKEIKDMELGAYVDRKKLKKYLLEQGYKEEEINKSGLFTAGLGDTHTLAILWRSISGRALGISGRTINSDIKPKYVNSAGLEKVKGFIGFERIRKGKTENAILVEGVLDALRLNADKKTDKPAIALGGTEISKYQIQALEDAGIRYLILALDNDEAGKSNTEKLIKRLMNSNIYVSVIEFPEGIKDFDEFLTKNISVKELKTEAWATWLPKRIFSKYSVTNPIGFRKALDECIEILSQIKKPIDWNYFIEALSKASDLTKKDIEDELEQFTGRQAEEQTKAKLKPLIDNINQAINTGDLDAIESTLEKTQDILQERKGLVIPEPHFLNDYLKVMKETPEGLLTGFKDLDKKIRIPQGAITIIAGRPRHGKSTLMLNMMVRMIEQYPNKAFYFFSYELPWDKIITMFIMSVAKEKINGFGELNFDAYEGYIKNFEKNKGNFPKIDKALKYYDELTRSGRLYIFDKAWNDKELKKFIIQYANKEDTGAIFVDYLQKIPLENAGTQRYIEIKQASEALREAAVTNNIPIIAGAQLKREQNSKGKANKPRLENLRESGDIEQDASLVLGIYNKKAEDIDSQKETEAVEDNSIEVIILKNRFGVMTGTFNLKFDGSIFSVDDQENIF